MNYPLAGVRVLDASTMLAAPMSATLLAELGAEVIKVEMPKTGDPARGMAPYANGESLHWRVTGRNRKSITLDLHRTEGVALFHQLVAKSDVVTTNFRPQKLREWGIDYDDLVKTRPDIVMLHLSAFGRTGPYSSRPGFARVAESLGGLTHVTGYPDRPPIFAGYPIADGIAGYYGAFSLMAALRHRDLSGEGQLIDLALYEPILRMMEDIVVGYGHNGVIKERVGNDQANICPNNLYPTADGKFVILPVSTEQMWRRLVELIDNPDLELYPTNAIRLENREAVDALVTAYTVRHPLDELLQQFEAANLACGTVYSIADIFEDPQIRHRQNLTTVHDPVYDCDVTVQSPIPHYSTITPTVTAAPTVGQHNEEICGELLGIDPEALRELTANGIM